MSRLSAPEATPTNVLDRPPADARSLLAAWAGERGLPGYRVGQMLRRLWQAPVASWAEATELPLALRAKLDAAFPLPRLAADVEQLSADGTRKFLWRLPDGEAVESVLIPSGTRRTLCISSQAGCALKCSFCATGRMGFRRNLIRLRDRWPRCARWRCGTRRRSPPTWCSWGWASRCSTGRPWTSR